MQCGSGEKVGEGARERRRLRGRRTRNDPARDRVETERPASGPKRCQPRRSRRGIGGELGGNDAGLDRPVNCDPKSPILPAPRPGGQTPVRGPGPFGAWQPVEKAPRRPLLDARAPSPRAFRGGALFPRAGGANRCAIPPANYRGEGATPSPHPSPVGAPRRRGLSGLSPRAAGVEDGNRVKRPVSGGRGRLRRGCGGRRRRGRGCG